MGSRVWKLASLGMLSPSAFHESRLRATSPAISRKRTDEILSDRAASGSWRPKTAQLMLERGISLETVEQVTYQNALRAFGQSGQMLESDWLTASPIDQSQKFSGNSILRGGQTPTIQADASIIR